MIMEWGKELWNSALIPMDGVPIEFQKEVKKGLDDQCSPERIGKYKQWRGSAEPDVSIDYTSCNPDKMSVNATFDSFDLSPLGSKRIKGRFAIHMNPEREKKYILLEYHDYKVGNYHLNETVQELFSLHDLGRGSIEDGMLCLETNFDKTCYPFERKVVYYNPVKRNKKNV